MRTLIAAVATVLLFVGAASADVVSDQFGSRVTQFHQYKAPFLSPDLNGDGAADAVYLVTIAPGTPKAAIAGDVVMVSNLFMSQPLGNAGANMAVGIVLGKSNKKFLLTGYRGDEYADYFDSAIWNERSVQLRAVARGSEEFRKCQARYKFLKHDYLSMKGDGDYEDFVWWDGRTFKPDTISPANPPCILRASTSWQ